MNGIATCKDLNRFAMAWGGVVRHARDIVRRAGYPAMR